MGSLALPSGIPSLTIAGRVCTDLQNLIVLVGSGSSPSNYNSTLRKTGSSSGYQVTAGKTLQIFAYDCIWDAPGVGVALLIAYSDTDLGIRGAVVPTNPVYPAGTSTSSAGLCVALYQSTQRPYRFDIPSGKYPYIVAAGTNCSLSVIFYGYEV